MAAVIVAYVWRTTPFNILLYHAALQGIPRELLRGGRGGRRLSAGQRFWHVTLPLLRPIIAVTLILRTTFGFMVFDEILAITQGGPGNDTWVAAWYTYKRVVPAAVQRRTRRRLRLGAHPDHRRRWPLLYVRFVYRRVEAW